MALRILSGYTECCSSSKIVVIIIIMLWLTILCWVHMELNIIRTTLYIYSHLPQDGVFSFLMNLVDVAYYISHPLQDVGLIYYYYLILLCHNCLIMWVSKWSFCNTVSFVSYHSHLFEQNHMTTMCYIGDSYLNSCLFVCLLPCLVHNNWVCGSTEYLLSALWQFNSDLLDSTFHYVSRSE